MLLVVLMQVRCWEVQQNGTVIPKAQQTHAGPVLDVAWSDVMFSPLIFGFISGSLGIRKCNSKTSSSHF